MENSLSPKRPTRECPDAPLPPKKGVKIADDTPSTSQESSKSEYTATKLGDKCLSKDDLKYVAEMMQMGLDKADIKKVHRLM